MTVYGDLLFIINFSMDFLCFYLSCLLLHRKMKVGRACLAAALGGVYSVASLFISASGVIAFAIDMVMLVLMCFIAYGIRKMGMKALVKAIFLYFFVSALLGGLMEAKDRCDVTISIDCDGQDDINAVDEMLREYKNGCDIVYGVRDDRKSDTAFKRGSAHLFYKLLEKIGAESVYNHADYRLMSKRALEALSEFKEVNLYLRGMVTLVGFKSTSVYYKRTERVAGKSHYPIRKMLKLALNGITSLSVKPIHLITAFGLFVMALSLVGIVWSVISYFLSSTVAGWASLVAIICFFGGAQIMCIGVIGEYIGKMYMETKARPRYIIADKTED